MKRLIPLILLISVFAGTQKVIACSCAKDITPSRSAELADAVFVGKVVQIEPVQKVFSKVNKLEVIKVLKGELGSNVDIHTSGGCEFVFRTGYEYLVYARKYDTYLTTSSCSGSRQLGTSPVDPTYSNFDIEIFKELENWQQMRAQPILSHCSLQADHNESLYDFKNLLCNITELHKKANKTSRPTRKLQKIKPVIKFNQFDVNEYFSILRHIQLPADQVLDHLYVNDVLYPILYLREKSALSFSDYADFLKKIGGYNKATFQEKAIPNDLEIDGSRLSFVELVVFKEFAGKFHLPEHYYYPPPSFISTSEDIEKIIQQRTENGGGHRMSNEQISAARQISPEPVVEINDDSATVHLVSFSCKSGFVRHCYSIAKTRPHNILECKPEILVKDNCGINTE